MATLLLVLVVVLVVAGLAFGVISLLAGDDPGLVPASPDGFARPLPGERALLESDLKQVRLDVGLRGYRMDQVDLLIRRVAHDVGYKNEVIAVLEAEVDALRAGRIEDAELLRKIREDAARPEPPVGRGSQPDAAREPEDSADADQEQVDDLTVEVTDLPEAEVSADEPDERQREGTLRRRPLHGTVSFAAVDDADPVVTGVVEADRSTRG